MLPNQLTDKLSPLIILCKSYNCSASQIFHLLWNPKVHYHVYKGPLFVSFQGQIKSFHPSHSIFNVYFNIILPSVPVWFKMSYHCDWSVCMQHSHVHHTSFFIFLLMLLLSTDSETPHYTSTSLSTTSCVLDTNILLSSLLSNALSSFIWETKLHHTQQQMKLCFYWGTPLRI